MRVFIKSFTSFNSQFILIYKVLCEEFCTFQHCFVAKLLSRHRNRGQFHYSLTIYHINTICGLLLSLSGGSPPRRNVIKSHYINTFSWTSRSICWKTLEEVEYATLEWVDWCNNRRLLEPIWNIPIVEIEKQYYEHIEGSTMVAWFK